jgi:hypothetical protein
VEVSPIVEVAPHGNAFDEQYANDRRAIHPIVEVSPDVHTFDEHEDLVIAGSKK